MKPSEALELHRSAIRSVVGKNDACNPRVFGSVLHGDDTENSDVDHLPQSMQTGRALIGEGFASKTVAAHAMNTGAKGRFGINNGRQQPHGPSLAGAFKPAMMQELLTGRIRLV